MNFHKKKDYKDAVRSYSKIIGLNKDLSFLGKQELIAIKREELWAKMF